MPFSDDVIKLNPELAKAAHAEYRTRTDRLPITDGFDSDLERDFNAELLARGWEVRPHGFTFHLPGGVDYTPDFIAWSTPLTRFQSLTIVGARAMRVYEVKGNLKQKNARDSRTRFKIAAGLYPACEFYWVTRRPNGAWIETRLA